MENQEIDINKAAFAIFIAIVVVFSIAFITQMSSDSGQVERSVAEEEEPQSGGRIMRILSLIHI